MTDITEQLAEALRECVGALKATVLPDWDRMRRAHDRAHTALAAYEASKAGTVPVGFERRVSQAEKQWEQGWEDLARVYEASKATPAQGQELEMPIESALPKDAPVMLAWERFKATPEYANSKRWASTEHVEGSLWRAFFEGFHAAQGQDIEGLVDRLQKWVGQVRDAGWPDACPVGLEPGWSEPVLRVGDLRALLAVQQKLTGGE